MTPPDDPQTRPTWWRPIWLCLAGEQPLPNIIPILEHEPVEVHLLHSDWPASAKVAQRCAAFLLQRKTRTHLHEVDAYDPESIRNKVVELGDRLGYGQILLNWTGGTKPMSLGALSAVPEHVPTLYYDTRKGFLLNRRVPYLQASKQVLGSLSLADHLALNSGTILKSHDTARGSGRATLRILGPLLKQQPSPINRLFEYREKHLKNLRTKKGWRPVPLAGIPRPFENFNPSLASTLAKAMQQDKLLISLAPFRPTNPGLDFLHGFWFEGYVQQEIQAAFETIGGRHSPVFRNLEIAWPPSRATNEIDLGFLWEDRLFLVSCTTASESEAAKRHQDIENLATRLGGRFAKAMLATTLPTNIVELLRGRQSFSTRIVDFAAWADTRRTLEDWARA